MGFLMRLDITSILLHKYFKSEKSNCIMKGVLSSKIGLKD